MKQLEAEKSIRYLCHQWLDSLPSEKREHPSFYQFKNWLNDKGYGGYLNFRAVAGADYMAEMWFDDELDQNWRR